MPVRRPPKQRPLLTAARLEELAIFYVGRFATSRAKLSTYLKRKVRERGWEGDRPADLEALVERLSRLGYVDDRAYALAKARALTARGYGEGRVRQALHGAGIGEEDGAAARTLAEEAALDSALRFARRRRLGPFGGDAGDPKQRERAVAAMVRAGHGFALVRSILALKPGEEIEPDLSHDLG
ncbi:MAG: RecX family transcriptional regulator [Sphingomonas sp.]|uniref:regulatory protein RecX n=1 Tax=Sphingomonas sp. TaxID=28214 RepID=UPI0017B4DA0C|nr:RecX family transcriptional regulator [Sphingomonas sp.]MBA3668038.1 RecX family transcriptional regulator [Sphingomonas sp.]